MLLNHWAHGSGGIPMPVGAIFGYDSANPLPAELSSYNSYNSRFIRGTATDSLIKTTGGSNSVSGSTLYGGLHGSSWDGDTGGGVYDIGYPDHPNEHQCDWCRGGDGGNHYHNYSVTYYPSSCRAKLVRVNSPVTVLPEGAIVFSKDTLEDLVKYATFNNASGMLYAHSSCGTAGSSVSGNIHSASDWHNHTTSDQGGHYEIYNAYDGMNSSGGAHIHSWSPSVSFSPKTTQLIAWKLTEELRRECEGLVVMYDQSGVPDGWTVCDGTGGTPDVNGVFVRFGSSYVGVSGGNTLQVWGDTTSLSHNHTFVDYLGWMGCTIIGHTLSESHYHSINTTHSFTAPFVRLKFIMYTG